jgi:hypothetical protein
VIEAPLNDARSNAVIAETQSDAPNFSAITVSCLWKPLQLPTLALAAPPRPGARHLGDSGWSATPAAVAASKERTSAHLAPVSAARPHDYQS